MGQSPSSILCIFFGLCTTLAILCFSWPASAADTNQETSWELSADRLTHDQESTAITAEGNVILKELGKEKPYGVEINADRIHYNTREQQVEAVGNLRLRERYGEIKATRATIDLDKQTGLFNQATLFRFENNLHLSGDLLEKTGKLTYHLENGKFTSCTAEEGEAPSWSIWSKDVNVDLSGYAKLKHATFRIKDVPVLYSPYLLLPALAGNKSGFLLPELSKSDRNGTGVIVPFFISMTPSYDMTIYGGDYSKRGTVLGAEFRYLAGLHSKGNFMASYIDDSLDETVDDEYKSDGYVRTNSKRYWIRGKANHDFGNRLVGRLDVDVLSDRDYLQEFKNGILGFNNSNSYFIEEYNRGFQSETVDLRENTLQLSKIWSTTDLQTELSVVDDEQPGPVDDTPIWAVPRITYSGLLPILQTPVDLTWGSEYVYYWRDEGIGAHRLDLFPQLNGPLTKSPYVEASYLLGLRETLYSVETHGDLAEEQWTKGDFQSRAMYNVGLNLATTAVRDYKLSVGSFKTFRHAIRPELFYLYADDIYEDELPQLDSKDDIDTINWLKYSLNNYFRVIRIDDPVLFNNNFSSLEISQVYDFDAPDHPFSDLYFELILRTFEDLYLLFETTVSMYGEGVTLYSLETRYANQRGDIFNLDYRYKNNPQIEAPYFFTKSDEESLHEITSDFKSKLSTNFSARYNLTYSFSSSSMVDSSFSLIYHPHCWSTELTFSKTPDDKSFTLLFSLSGLGNTLKLGLP
jgi:LPS-assembly protein